MFSTKTNANNLKLNIAHFILDMDISRLETKLYQELEVTFHPFIIRNGQSPHETLKVIPIKTTIGKRVSQNLETFIRQSLQVPLSKFPFTGDLEREVDYGVKRLRPFSKNADFKAYISGSHDPKAVALYWLHKGCLIRKHDATTSSLFLKARCKRSVKIASIYGAIYFTASVALPLLNGIMVHGVGINRRGVGLLFLGLSGAGKTTVAQLSDPAEVIADDGIILEHKEGDYFLATTPFDQLSSCSRRGIISPNYRSRLTMGTGQHRNVFPCFGHIGKFLNHLIKKRVINIFQCQFKRIGNSCIIYVLAGQTKMHKFFILIQTGIIKSCFQIIFHGFYIMVGDSFIFFHLFCICKGKLFVDLPYQIAIRFFKSIQLRQWQFT